MFVKIFSIFSSLTSLNFLNWSFFKTASFYTKFEGKLLKIHSYQNQLVPVCFDEPILSQVHLKLTPLAAHKRTAYNQQNCIASIHTFDNVLQNTKADLKANLVR